MDSRYTTHTFVTSDLKILNISNTDKKIDLDKLCDKLSWCVITEQKLEKQARKDTLQRQSGPERIR